MSATKIVFFLQKKKIQNVLKHKKIYLKDFLSINKYIEKDIIPVSEEIGV